MLAILAEIPSSYQRASSPILRLALHRVIDDLGLGTAFSRRFVSHLTGRIKSDAEALQHVVESLGCKPGQELLLDDNVLNVGAAYAFGMQAVRVQGNAEARPALIERGIIEEPSRT